MSQNNLCPDCKKIYLEKPTRCICGWQRIEADHFYDPRCQFVSQNKRCNLPGSISPDVKGNKWYCYQHWRSPTQPVNNYPVTNVIESDPRHIDWRVQHLLQNGLLEAKK